MLQLSDAIRAGCVGTYKIKYCLLDQYGGYCVWGAALHGLGLSDRQMFDESFYVTDSLWLWADDLLVQWVDLNNKTAMSREAIADLVELKEWELGIRVPAPSEPPVVDEGELLVIEEELTYAAK